MNYAKQQIYAPSDIGASGTKDIEIKLSQMISEILIKFKTTKASEGMSAPGPANITKIELLDGSYPLHSLNGYQNQALAYYSRPGIQMEHGQHTSGLSEVDLYLIPFGRHLWDEILALDPTRYKNLQLHITWDEDVSDTSVSVNELEVWAHVFDEKSISPMGYLRATELDSWTPEAANAYHWTSFPEDRVLRQILLRAYQDAYEPWYNIDEALFQENMGNRKPFDFTNLEEYYRMMKAYWPCIRTNCQVNLATSARNFYFPQTDYWSTVLLMGLAADVAPYINSVSMRGGKAAMIAGSAGQMIGQASGWLPWHCYQFPMGKQMEIEDWYDPSGKAPRMRTRASTGGSSVTGEMVIEELEKY